MRTQEEANRDAVRDFDDPVPHYEGEDAYNNDREEQSHNVIEDVERQPSEFKAWLDDPSHADVVGVDDIDPFGQPRPKIPKVFHEARKRGPSKSLFERQRAVEAAQDRLAQARAYKPPVVS